MEVKILKEWLSKRVEWIDRQFTRSPKFSHESQRVEKETSVKIEVSDGAKFYWTTDGSDPRGDDGKVSQNASSDRSVRVDESLVVTARARKGVGPNSWSAPVRKVFLTSSASKRSNLKLVAANVDPPILAERERMSTGYKPADFEYLHLVNTSKERSVDLTGSKFTDGIKFTFDRATITKLSPGKELFIVRNKKAFLARYGAEKEDLVAGAYSPSKLRNEGERLSLENGVGEILFDLKIPLKKQKKPK